LLGRWQDEILKGEASNQPLRRGQNEGVNKRAGNRKTQRKPEESAIGYDGGPKKRQYREVVFFQLGRKISPASIKKVGDPVLIRDDSLDIEKNRLAVTPG